MGSGTPANRYFGSAVSIGQGRGCSAAVYLCRDVDGWSDRVWCFDALRAQNRVRGKFCESGSHHLDFLAADASGTISHVLGIDLLSGLAIPAVLLVSVLAR